MSDSEKRKTFYFYFKPLGVLAKTIGIFPVKNIIRSNDPQDLKVKWFSWEHLYSVSIFGALIYTIYFFSGFLFNASKSFYLYIVVYVMMARSSFCFLFCLTHSKKLPKLVKLLDMFDRRKTHFLNEKPFSMLESFVKWTIIPIIIGFMSYGISIFESAMIVVETIPSSLGHHNMGPICFGLLNTWQIVPLLLYIFFSSRIIRNFVLINKALRARKCSGFFFDENRTYDHDMSQVLEYLRLMHNMMAKTVDELGKCYGNFMAVDQLFIIVMVVVNICTFINDRTHEYHLLLFTLFNGVLVVSATIASNTIKEKAAKFLYLLDGIQFSKIDDRTRIEIQTFMIQLAARPVVVDAAGYYVIDKRQIPSMLSAIATYLIVAFQFLDELSSQTISNMTLPGVSPGD